MNKTMKKRKYNNDNEVKNEETKIKTKKIEKNIPLNENVIDESAIVDDTVVEKDQLNEEINQGANKKFKNSFNIKNFRKKIKEYDFISDFYHFLQAASKNHFIIQKYLETGGQPLELVTCLDKIDKNSLEHISCIFQVLQLVLIEILSNSSQYSDIATNGCRFLLNKHRSCVEKLLESSNVAYKKSAIKVLTAAVALEARLGYDILKLLNTKSGQSIEERFTKYRKEDILNQNEESLRTCFIHFVLAFLVEGNSILIHNIMEKPELIVAILSGGLTYDNIETVTLVLGTLKKFILKMQIISKTQKYKIFTEDIVKQLLELYEWKGPKGYLASHSNKSVEDVSPNEEDAELIANAVQDFLILLLSSYKYGIAFQCLGNQKTKHNRIQKEILRLVEHPWNNEKHSVLVIQILKSCPELLGLYLRNISRSVDVSKSNCWMKAMNFTKSLIEAMKPTIISKSIQLMGMTEVSHLIRDICLSSEILDKIRDKAITHDKSDIRLITTQILTIMLTQCNNYLTELVKWNVLKEHEIKHIKFDLFGHIFMKFPSVDKITYSLYQTIQEKGHSREFILEHLEATIDLLLRVAEVVPSFIEKTSTLINYIQILGPIYSQKTSEKQDNQGRIELKTIKLILTLDPHVLAPETDLFQHIITSFINVYIFGSLVEQNEVKKLLRNVLKNTGLFENGNLEIDLWLEAFRLVDRSHLNVVQQFFIKLIKRIKTSSNENQNDLIDFQTKIGDYKNENISKLLKNIEENVTLQGIMNAPSIGIVLPMTLASLKKKNTSIHIISYLETVIFYLFHFLPNPEVLRPLISTISLNIEDYIEAWLVKNEFHLPNEFSYKTIHDMIQSIMDKKENFLELFPSKPNNESLNEQMQNETQVMIMIYVILFLVAQLAKNKKFDEKTASACSHYLTHLLDFLRELCSMNKIDSSPEQSDELMTIQEDTMDDSVHQSLKYIFRGQYHVLQYFNVIPVEDSDTNKNNKSVTQFITSIIRHIQKWENIESIDDYTIYYRNQFVTQIREFVRRINEQHSFDMNTEMVSDLMTIFQWTDDNCKEMATSLIDLPLKNFLSTNGEKNVFTDILVILLNRLAILQSSTLNGDVVTGISNIILSIYDSNESDGIIEKLFDALQFYISTFHDSIGFIPDEMFEKIFSGKRSVKSAIKFAATLFERNDNLNETFLQLLRKNYNKKEVTYPFLNVAFQKNMEINEETLILLYNEFKNGIFKIIEKPHKAGVIYRENLNSSLGLIKSCMPSKECVDYCRKTLKAESVDIYQCELLKTIHLKAFENSKDSSIYLHFIASMINLLTTMFKKGSPDCEKMSSLSSILIDWLKLQDQNENLREITYETISSSAYWQAFCKNCLKYGLQSNAGESNPTENESLANLLKLVALLCDRFYPTDSDQPEPGQFYEMVFCHSEFFNIVLQPTKSDIKTNLMYLLSVLARKNPSILNAKHIPILLGSYNAKLSKCDRYILSLLHLYEKNGVSLHEYRPMLWGEAAISHYSLRSADLPQTMIEEPSMDHVMSLIDPDTMTGSLANFPIWRTLNPLQDIPVENCHQDSDNVTITSNLLEKTVEQGCTHIPENLTKLLPKKDETYDDIYDPAFFVPLMSMIFAPENFGSPFVAAQNGMLALMFSALSSYDLDMRLAAGFVLRRYKSQMEGRKSFLDQKVWMHFYSGFQNGLFELTQSVPSTDTHMENLCPRLPHISAVFMAKTTIILTSPLDRLYRPICDYLLSKEKYDFTSIPNFNFMFLSPDVEHQSHRGFLLNVITDGIKCDEDFDVLDLTASLETIMVFFSCPFASIDTNLRILNIVNTIVRIPNSAKVMIQKYGLIAWLTGIISNLEGFYFDTIDGIVHIVSNLWYSVKILENQYSNFDELQYKIFHLIIRLTKLISTRMSCSVFSKFCNIFNKVSVGKFHLIPDTDVDHLIECSKTLLDLSHVKEIIYLRDHGEKFAENKLSYVKKLKASEHLKDKSKIFALVTLREFIINFLRAKKI